MMTRFGMIVDIKIQSISDIITNSSTEVFTIYRRTDLDTIVDIVDAILAINGEYSFDDLFTIELTFDEYALEYLYDNSYTIQAEFKSFDEFSNYLKNADERTLSIYEDIYTDTYNYYRSRSLYGGYVVKIKEGIEQTDLLNKAMNALNRLDCIFEYDYTEC